MDRTVILRLSFNAKAELLRMERAPEGENLLPLIWGIDGIWISIVAAELMAVVLTVIFLILKRKKYHY